MRIVVTGANGQLGSEIKSIAQNYKNCVFFFESSTSLNICNFLEIKKFFREKKIDTVINCAGYTAVDLAEKEPEIAEKVNSEGVSNLVKALKEVNGRILHISTDYVFDGNSTVPLKEDDLVSPIGVYGRTKRNGELIVNSPGVNGIVIRTSWLYSIYGNNFLKTMLRLGTERDEIEVVFDQVGTPTYARDLAKVCLDILQSKEGEKKDVFSGVYHFSNEGVASWYDFAVAVMALGKVECDVRPIETDIHLASAKRPHYSVLNKSKLKNTFGLVIPYWRDSLESCIERLEK